MADSENSALAGVQRDEYPSFDQFVGTRADLVAAGVADASKFPGDPGNKKTSVTYRDGGQRVRIEKAGKSGFRVRRRVSGDEENRRRAAFEVECERHRAEELARFSSQQAKRDLEKMATSAAKFCQSFQRSAQIDLNVMLQGAREGDGGYCLCASSLDEVEEAAGELLDAIRRAQVVYSSAKRTEQIARYRARIAAGDPAFRSFMFSLGSPGRVGRN